MLQRAEMIVQIVHPCSSNGSCASGAQTISSDKESLSMLGWEDNNRLHLLHYHLSFQQHLLPVQCRSRFLSQVVTKLQATPNLFKYKLMETIPV